MIVRDEGDSFLLITQPDHGALAAQIVAAMATEPALQTDGRELVLFATREHDNGWIEVDAEPTITPAGRPCDFIEGPAPIKHTLWPRGITRAAATHPRAGALVAEHALTVYAYRRHEPEWRSFFLSIEALHQALLGDAGVSDGMALDRFRQEYRCVRLGDSFSLQFCNGWHETQETLGYRAALRGTTLFIAPDPFNRMTVPLRIAGRRIPSRVYADDIDLRAAFAAAAPVTLIGEARGVDDVTGL
jgi:hypothetical protein